MQEAIDILSRDPVFSRILDVEINVPYYDGDVNTYLYSSIISQQLSTKAADAIYSRFLDHFDGTSPSPSQVLESEDLTLRTLGLSMSKIKYIRNVATYFRDNEFTEQHWPRKSDEEIIRELSSIKGVGVWTVQMVLIFCLARKDVFPILDLGVRNSAISLYDLKGEKKVVNQQLIEIAETWRPFRTIASLYLWAWRNQAAKNGKENR